MSRRSSVLVTVLSVLTSGAPLTQEPAAMIERGAAVYQAQCIYCHDPAPESSPLVLPGVEQLTLKYDGALSPYITERRDLANFEVLRVFLRNGVGSMPPFRRTEVTDEDIEALAAYFESTSSD